MAMRIEEFDYDLPGPLIAQYPALQRAESRLMVLRRDEHTIEHRFFRDIIDCLRSDDLLVVNNSRVLPVRLIGKRETGGKCEVLLIPSRNGSRSEWEALVKNAKKVKPGTRIRFGEGLTGEIREVKRGRAKIRFPEDIEVMDRLQEVGHIPLPPYIKREDEPLDRVRYQTIFAEHDGSIASPTAGLHFTRSLLETIRTKGVRIAPITLHVGIGTFAPVRTEEIEDHSMENEWVEISEDTREQIEKAKRGGGRVIAVGTTTTRALESFAISEGRIKAGQEYSSLFIYPPFRFRIIDGLITNFHLPQSTLLLLVSAFAGKDFLRRAYDEAVAMKYRFYSYGDAMLIL